MRPCIRRAGFRLPDTRLHETGPSLGPRDVLTSSRSDSQLWIPSSVFSGLLRPETECHSLGRGRPRWRLLRYTPVSEEFDFCRMTQATMSTLINMHSQSLQSCRAAPPGHRDISTTARPRSNFRGHDDGHADCGEN